MSFTFPHTKPAISWSPQVESSQSQEVGRIRRLIQEDHFPVPMHQEVRPLWSPLVKAITFSEKVFLEGINSVGALAHDLHPSPTDRGAQ